jgi:hypothetical protein
MALVIVILALLSTLVFFYLKCSMMQSLMTLWSAVLATIIAFSYYEWVAELLISRGYGMNVASSGCFILLFVVVFASLRALSEFVMIGPVDLGNAVKLPVSLLCGLLAGIIISGNLLVALGLLPMHGKIFYSRFSPDSPVALNSPQKPALSTDGFVAGLYRLISSGSLRSSKSFGVLHADYLSQVHLNKLKTKDEILSICAQEALIMPTGKIKKPVRLITVNDKELTVIRVGVKSKKVDDGGASNASGVLQFFPGQLRLIVKEANAATEPMAGTATTKYPVGLWEDGKVTEWELDQIIAPDSTQIENRVYWMDVAFQCSNGETPILLEFRQNAVIELPKAAESTPEIEGELNNDGEKDASL